jgi:hypothetical protein
MVFADRIERTQTLSEYAAPSEDPSISCNETNVEAIIVLTGNPKTFRNPPIHLDIRIWMLPSKPEEP